MTTTSNNKPTLPTISSREGTQRSALVIDNKAWQDYIDLSDAPDDQKEEFIRALWGIICEFVEIGYGVHPLQDVDTIDDRHLLLSPQILEEYGPCAIGGLVPEGGNDE